MKKSGLIVLFLVICINLVIANHVITTSTGTTSYTADEDITKFYNISVENTDSDVNISQVNITIPSSFSFLASSNGNDASGTFSNDGNVLDWVADNLVVNQTTNYFWFNLTGTTPGVYNLSVQTLNVSGSFITNISVVINDTTVPSGVEFVTPADKNSSVQDMVLNVSVADNGEIDTITLKLYNSTHDEINSSTGTGDSLYANFTGNLTDGAYYANATVNDSFGNSNSSVTMNITLDDTDPSISFSCSSSSVDRNDDLTCECSGTDAIDGNPDIDYDSSPDTSELGDFTTTCTVTDDAGNSVSASEDYNVGSGSSSSGSSSSSSHSWDATFFVNADQFLEGFSKELEENERFKIKVDGVMHFVGIIEIDDEEVTINVSSDPQQAVLKVGENKKFDVDDNSDNYDLLVILMGINDSEANITVKSINEKIPESDKKGQNGIGFKNGNVSLEDIVDGAGDTIQNQGKRIWVYVLVGIVVLIVLGVGGKIGYEKYKKKRYYHRGY